MSAVRPTILSFSSASLWERAMASWSSSSSCSAASSLFGGIWWEWVGELSPFFFKKCILNCDQFDSTTTNTFPLIVSQCLPETVGTAGWSGTLEAARRGLKQELYLQLSWGEETGRGGWWGKGIREDKQSFKLEENMQQRIHLVMDKIKTSHHFLPNTSIMIPDHNVRRTIRYFW